MSWSKFINALTDLDGFVSIYLFCQSWICLQPRLLSLRLRFCCWIETHTRPEATKLKKEMKEAKKIEKDEKRRQKMHDERQSVIDERKQYCITFIPHRCSCCFSSFFFSGTTYCPCFLAPWYHFALQREKEDEMKMFKAMKQDKLMQSMVSPKSPLHLHSIDMTEPSSCHREGCRKEVKLVTSMQ